MQIKYVDKISSTHKVLTSLIRDDEINYPIALYAGEQSDAIGSRGNSWECFCGNLFLSVALPTSSLPLDLPAHSTSIYFSQLMLNILREKNSRAYLKWPNDFYIDDSKLGGVITTKIKDFMVISVGLNLKEALPPYTSLDVNIDSDEFVQSFVKVLDFLPSWKHIFSIYKLEFPLSQKFFANVDGKKVPLKDAKLLDDGSIWVENKKVYSLR